MVAPHEPHSALPLSGLRVLELADGIAGPYAGKLLGDLGAEIIKVEPPCGDSARMLGPFPNGVADRERSGMDIYLNSSKQRLTLDVDRRADVEACQTLAASVAVVVESERDRYGLDTTTLRSLNPSVVLVSVTPFGQTGPLAAWRGNDLIAFHSSGFAFGFPALEVDNACLPPLNSPTYAAELLAGQVAAAAAMHGVLVAQQSGSGSHLDISLQEAVASANNSQFNRTRTDSGRIAKRTFSDKPSNSVVALLPCSDGWVAISPREEHQWSRWLDVMGRPPWSAEARFADRASRDRHWSELYPLLAQWSRGRTKTEVFQAAQAQRVASLPLGTAMDLLDSAQLAAREFFVRLHDPDISLPGRPYHLSISDQRETAPLSQQPSEHALHPLEGIRVVDFSWVLTGPICTRYLASLGAEVIKIESAARPDLSSRDLGWQELNPSKRSITLNLKQQRARKLARELIAHSDVVVENFSTGVMERLGLDYPHLQQINARIIMASSSAFGRTGPDREQVAYGTLVQCLTGWAALSAYPGYPPRSAGGVWTDPLTAVFETLLVLAAIRHQRATGQGALIDLSMAETTIAALPEPTLAWSLAHEVLQPRGNRHPVHAPQGCYPARGEDRWVALSIQSDAEWETLCHLMERADLLADTRFAKQAGRQLFHDVLDRAIAAWSVECEGDALAEMLQSHGIAATASLHPEDVITNAHLRARSFLAEVERVDGSGTFTSAATPWLINGHRPHSLKRPPTLGEDNAYVFKSLLKMPSAEYDRLIQEQVIY